MCPPNVMDRLEAEAKQLFEQVSMNEGQVGSAEPITYDQDWASENGLGRFGRMTIDSGEAVYHAAPSKIDRSERFNFFPKDSMAFINAWQNGDKYEDPVDHLLRVQMPEPKVKTGSYKVFDYEEKLFSGLVQTDPVTLVNPSFKTMAALIQHTTKESPGYVMLTAQEGSELWEEEIKDFIRNSGGRLKMTVRNEVSGVSYLGSADPVFYPTTEWCRLVPSPFVEHVSEYQSFTSKFTNQGFFATYERKDHLATASVIFDAPVYRWNPETVDKSLSRTERKYFLESNKRLFLKGINVTDLNHRPFFLSSYGEWEGKWNKKGNFVYDYRETDPNQRGGNEGVNETYLSRRAMHKPPEGYTWAPFEVIGEFVVTVSCITPFRRVNVNFFNLGDRDIISVDGSIPVITDVMNVVKGKIVGYDGFPAKGLIIEKSEEDDFCFRTIGQGYISPKNRSETGISWDPGQGAFIPSLLSFQTLRSLPVFDVGPEMDIRLVDVTDLKGGFYCIASSTQNLKKAIPGFSAYLSKRWIGREDWSHLPIEPNDGGYGAGDAVAAQIMEFLSLQPERPGKKKSASSFEIAKALNVPIRTVEQYCYRLPDIFQWKQVESGYHEWIRRLDLDCMLPDGSMSYARAIEKLRKFGHVPCKGGFGHFHTFLLLNGIMVNLKLKAEFQILYLY